jgi:hypothetical protein
MPPTKVFVSVGRTSTPEQEAFVSAIERYMTHSGLLPQALGRNYWSSQQPLRAIDELMSECSGVAIVGFERLQVLHAIERRGSAEERRVADVSLPSVWNQLEAAMAYVRGLPLLVLVQDGLRAEGLLEPGYDWYVKRLPLGAHAVDDREFRGIFEDWRLRVEAHRSTRPSRETRAGDTRGSAPSAAAREEMAWSDARRRLRAVLDTRFSDEELRVLCFDLDVDFENISGATKGERVVSIIQYFERRHRQQELLRAVRDLRPDEL